MNIYYGFSEIKFETRYANHEKYFNHQKHKNNAQLSNEFWTTEASKEEPIMYE